MFEKFVIPALFLLLFSTFQYAIGTRFNIVTSHNSFCPGEQNGVACFTLQEFISYGISNRNLSLKFEPGVHVLELRNQLSLRGARRESVYIVGNNSTIVCRSPYHDDNSFDFRSLYSVNISGITFVNCSTMYVSRVSRFSILSSNFYGQTRFTGLRIRYSNASLLSCTFTHLFTGLDTASASTVSVDSCIFNGNYRGIYMSSSRFYNSINSSIFAGNTICIYMSFATATIFNSTFRDNSYTSYGSAIYAQYRSLLVVSESTFINNTARSGAVYIRNVYSSFGALASIVVDRCIFLNNKAIGTGGALYVRVYSRFGSYHSSYTISKSVFINNQAAQSGGALYVNIPTYGYGNISIVETVFGYNTASHCGVLDIRGTSENFDIILQSSTFLYNKVIKTSSVSNHTINGGVACLRGVSVTVDNGTFSHNSASGGGGVLMIEDSNITISRSLFYNNTAGIDGGVLYTRIFSSNYSIFESSFTYNRAGDDGGAVYIGGTGSDLQISRSTVNRNAAVDRGGAMVVFRASFGINTCNIYNNQADFGNDIVNCSQTGNLNAAHATECRILSGFGRNHFFYYPEDRSNLRVSHYLEIPGAVSSQITSTVTVTVPTTKTTEISSTYTTEDQVLKNLQSKVNESLIVLYILFATTVAFIVIVAIVIVVKFLKHAKKGNLSCTSNNRNGSNGYNDAVDILYEEPMEMMRGGGANTISMKPNVVYRGKI